MDQRNVQFLIYGYSAAWLVIAGFVILLVSRGRKIDRELDRLKALVEDREREAR
jgi:CcmD family protein